MPIEQKIPITVNVIRYDAKTMIMRLAMGKGSTEDEEFDIGTNVGSGDPIFYFHKEGRYYSVSLREIAERVVELREKMGFSKEDENGRNEIGKHD